MSFDVERSIIFLLAKAYQHVVSLCSKEFSEYKITPPQLILLDILWKQDTFSQAELSEKTRIDRTTITGIIDRLEKRGLVERQSHPEDRRAKRIILTDRGRKLENELCDAASRVRDKVRMRFSPDEGKTLEWLLKRLHE
ncbi:MAG: MarR family transcriptional regulator [Desulfuromonadales bacterium]|nr:MarR family transcriptional regulator [Desulfuromonadales bacterium]